MNSSILQSNTSWSHRTCDCGKLFTKLFSLKNSGPITSRRPFPRTRSFFPPIPERSLRPCILWSPSLCPLVNPYFICSYLSQTSVRTEDLETLSLEISRPPRDSYLSLRCWIEVLYVCIHIHRLTLRCWVLLSWGVICLYTYTFIRICINRLYVYM